MKMIEQHRKYKSIVRFRRNLAFEDVFLPVKPEAEELEGQTVVVYSGWRIEEGIYEGEFAMLLQSYPDTLGWIASGDLTDIEEYVY